VGDKGSLSMNRPYRDTHEVTAGVARLVRAIGKRVAHEDPEDLVHLARLDEALSVAWRTAVTGLRATGYSDTQIGAELGITKQAVAQRWPRSATGEA
jgi:hypothetical protein